MTFMIGTFQSHCKIEHNEGNLTAFFLIYKVVHYLIDF